MKTFIVSLLIFALTIAGTVAGDFYLNDVAKNMEQYCQTLSDQTAGEGAEELEKAYKDMDEYWQKKKKILSVIIDHSHIGEIDKSLSEMKVAIETDERSEMLLAGARVKTVIENVAQNEHFHLSTIL